MPWLYIIYAELANQIYESLCLLKVDLKLYYYLYLV